MKTALVMTAGLWAKQLNPELPKYEAVLTT